MIALAIIWVLLVQAEGIFPGILARPEWGDGDRLFTGYFGWLATQGDARFLPDLMGGVDRYGFGRIGGEYFSLRLILLHYMPLWSVIVLSRLVVPLVAFAGIYLFSTRLLRCPQGLAFGLGMLFSVGYDFNATLTFLYGLSLAGMPLLLYLLFSRLNDWRGWLSLTLFAAAYIGTSDPIYWLPLLWISAISVHCWIRPRSRTLAYAGISVLSLLWVANYADVLLAFNMMLPFSARSVDGGAPPSLGVALMSQFEWMFGPSFRYNHAGPLFALPILFAIAVGFARRSAIVASACLATLILAFLPVLLAHVPWESLGLRFFATYRWYWEYGALAMALLAAASAGASLTESPQGKTVIRLALAMTIAVSINMFIVLKNETSRQTRTRGTLASLTEIPNLRQPEWRKDTVARVVTLPTLLDPNNTVNYGFATFDGGATLVSADIHTFWDSVVLQGPKPTREILGFGNNAAFNDCCEPVAIDTIADIDLLRLANVGYLISYRPLASAYLRSVSGPAAPKPIPRTLDMFAPPAPVFVYQLENPLPRVWWATGVVAEPASVKDLVTTLKDHALRGKAVLREPDLPGTNRKFDTGPLQVTQHRDKIEIETYGRGGLLLVNQVWLPWWQGVTNTGIAISPARTNLIQMALDVPEGTERITLTYRRPLVRDLLGF